MNSNKVTVGVVTKDTIIGSGTDSDSEVAVTNISPYATAGFITPRTGITLNTILTNI